MWYSRWTTTALAIAAQGLWINCGGRAELSALASRSESDAGIAGGEGVGGTGGSPASSLSTGSGGRQTSSTSTHSSADLTSSAVSTSTGGTGGPPEMPCDPPAAECQGLPASGSDDREVCVGSGYEREPISIDLLLVVDSSAQMGAPADPEQATRWQVVSEALLEFVLHDDLTAQSVGLQLYSSADPDRCDPTDYLMPSVGMVDPSMSLDLFARALADTEPGGTGMTRAAFSGALDFAEAWGEANPLVWPVVVLVAGPNLAGCEVPVDFGDIDALAKGAPQQHGVAAGVLLLDADFEAERDSCGEPSGVTRVVDSELGVAALLDELLAVYRRIVPPRTLRCEFDIPEPPPGPVGIDYDDARVVYSAAGEFEFPSLASRADCDDSPYGGWYYDSFDDTGRPTRVALCPCSCSELQNNDTSAVELSFGCDPGTGDN